MTHEPPSRSRQAQGSFHSLRIARRASHRSGSAPVKRRSRKSEIRDRRSRILVLLTMAFGFELSAAALTSPLLGINRIVIRGSEQLPITESVTTEQTVALPAGTNLLRAPLAQMEREIRTLPWVETARVRWLSAHALSVQFKPRDPAVVAQIAGQSYEIDRSGVPIRVARAQQAHKLPRIEEERSLDVRLGVPLHDDALLAAINIHYEALSQPMVRIAKIRVDPEGNMCLNMVDGIQVQLGQPEDLATKMRYIQRVYELEPNVASRMIAINLSYPKQPACTLKSDILKGPAESSDKSPTSDKTGSGGVAL